MTIRAKLILNVVLITSVIGILFVTSFMGMGFIKKKLFYLTEKSTPFQLRTVEFQRAIQATTSDFIKIGVASSKQNFNSSKSEAEQGLSVVKNAQQALEAMSGDKSSTHEDLEKIFTELVTVTGNRLLAEEEAANAAKQIHERQNETTTRLKNLDKQIKALQEGRSNSYAKSAEDKDKILNRVRSLEMMKTNLKELKLAVYETSQKAGKADAASILLAKIGQNSFVRGNPKLAYEVKTLTVRVSELGKIREGSSSKTAEIIAALDELIESATDEGDKEDDRYNDITTKQGAFQTQARLAVGSMAGNSELVAQGIGINELVTRLFVVTTPAELDTITAEINSAYARIGVLGKNLHESLKKIGAKKEMDDLTGAITSLNTIKGLLFSADGVISKLNRTLDMRAQATQVSVKLRDIVVAQMEQSKKTVSTAQSEQEQSISTVNRIVRFSMTFIGIISLLSVMAGFLFGFWIYRSISRPLAQLLSTTKHIANGDLTDILTSSSKDEVGQVQSSVGEMMRNLREILQKIHGVTDNLAASSYQLSGTAQSLESGAQRQSVQIDQAVTAIAEMSQTTMQMAKNSSETADAAGQMKELVRMGQNAMHKTVEEMNFFSKVASESADRVTSLVEDSEQIGEVVSFIRDIADQTNLLALNASIEAARAGDMGRGFAVVADNVRSLAERTNNATDEIGKMVIKMQGSISHSRSSFAAEQASLQKVVGNIEQTLSSIDEIALFVDKVAGMVREMSIAADDQSATSDEIDRNMVAIKAVTLEVSSCFNDIKESAESLSRIAGDLKTTVAWFKV